MQSTRSAHDEAAIVAEYLSFAPIKAICDRYAIPNAPALYKILDAHGIRRRQHRLVSSQQFDPEPRIRFTATVKVEEIVEASDVWMVIARTERLPDVVEVLSIERLH